MKRIASFLFVAFVTTVTALAVPVTIYTSCGAHNTDTELWDGMSIEDICAELEDMCEQDQPNDF